MKNDKDHLLPAMRRTSELAEQLERTRRALDVRDPITGFFHGLGSKAATKALDQITAEHQALKRNFDAQTDLVGGIINFRNSVDAYEARHELAPEYKQLALDRAHYDLELQRAAMRASLADANRQAIQSEHYRSYVERTGEKNIEIHMAAREAELAKFNRTEPAKPADDEDPIKIALQKIDMKIAAEIGKNGEASQQLYAQRAYLQSALEAGNKKPSGA